MGDNGIINMAQKAKENTELARTEEQQQLNSLYEELEKGAEGIFDDSMADVEAKLENFKKIIATAITNEGVQQSKQIPLRQWQKILVKYYKKGQRMQQLQQKI